jgi:hypothetical protein
VRWGIAGFAKCQDRRPHWISGVDSTNAIGSTETRCVGKTGGNPSCPRRQQPIGAAEYRILLVKECRQPKIEGR